jgi:hypothetical protein
MEPMAKGCLCKIEHSTNEFKPRHSHIKKLGPDKFNKVTNFPRPPPYLLGKK